MNINGLIRSLIGDLQTADPKVLELKIGQVVKGVVLQLLDDQMALLNISGVQVKAKLETPLKQGDMTLLQVQPESSSGQIILKPIASSDVQIPEESFSELLKAFDLKDSPANRQMVQQIQREGVPLSKENVQAFADVQSAIPANVGTEDWNQAAALAFKRNLPITAETVGSLQQVLSGKTLTDSLDELESRANAFLRDNPSVPVKVSEPLMRVLTLLKEIKEAPASMVAVPDEAPPIESNIHQAASTSAQPVSALNDVQPKDEKISSSTTSTLFMEKKNISPTVSTPLEPETQEKVQVPQSKEVQQSASVAEEVHEGNWIKSVLKSLGIEHEYQLSKLLVKPDLLLNKESIGLPINQDATEPVHRLPVDSLKSLLMQLSLSDELPIGLKESAQQAIQQITGQQLMLSADRASHFSHITMFIPFMNGNGQQSAAVHIQSRKGSRGELDVNNCRLLFDLSMKALGDTLIDVQVVNKIVSVNVHNDLPLTAVIIESSRSEISSALEKLGYQFLSMRCAPFPEKTAPQRTGDAANEFLSSNRSNLKSLVQPKPYKSVDYRI